MAAGPRVGHRSAHRAANIVVCGLILLATGWWLPAASADTTIPSYRSPNGGQSIVSWAVVPVDIKGQLDGRGRYSYTAKPGSTITDWMGVTNFGNAALRLRIDAVDAFSTPEGAFALLPPQRKSRDLGAWIDPEKSTLVVPARTRVSVPFTLRIPTNAEPGDHVAGIVATADGSEPSKGDQQVAVNFRTGSRVYLRVTGDIVGQLTIGNTSAEYLQVVDPFRKGSAQVDFQIRNVGNIRLSGTGTVRIRDVAGRQVGQPASFTFSDVLPKSRVNESLIVQDVAPVGLLRADIEITPVAPVGVSVSADDLTPVRESVWFPAFSLTVGLVFLGILLSTFFWWARRSGWWRRVLPQRSPPSPTDSSDAVVADDEYLGVS